MTWTHFWDMHSGGSQKEAAGHIYIEAPREEAESVFYARFGHNPNRVTCTCCGSDYSIDEGDSLEQLSGYHRGCRYDDCQDKYVEEDGGIMSGAREYRTLERYLSEGSGWDRDGAPIVIRASEIQNDERGRAVPEEGYVWR